MSGLAREHRRAPATRLRPGRPRRGRARCGCRWRSRPPRGPRAVSASSLITPAARPSGSASRSRSSSGAVLWETPSARSSVTAAPPRGRARARLRGSALREVGELAQLAVDAGELGGHDRDVDQEQRDEDHVGGGDVLAGLVERQGGHQLPPSRSARGGAIRDPPRGHAVVALERPPQAPEFARRRLGGELEANERHPQQRHPARQTRKVNNIDARAGRRRGARTPAGGPATAPARTARKLSGTKAPAVIAKTEA